MADSISLILEVSALVCSISSASVYLPPVSVSSRKSNIGLKTLSLKLDSSHLFGESRSFRPLYSRNRNGECKGMSFNATSAFAIDENDCPNDHTLLKVEEQSDDTLLFKFGMQWESDECRNEFTVDRTIEQCDTSHEESCQVDSGAPFQDDTDALYSACIGDDSLNSGDSGRTDNFDNEIEYKSPLHLDSGVCSLPHPAKANRGGEDAYFIEKEWVGVADGVSLWAELGINSGLYSRELMWNCGEVVRMDEVGYNPQLVIEEAHDRTDLKGSCTITVACLDNTTIRVANIGDSGFLLIRNGEIVEKSAAMMHAFNEPFQIGTVGAGKDDPSSAELFEFNVLPKDILLLGTDGLFDNVFLDIIVSTLTQSMEEGKSPEVAARRLANIAQRQGTLASGKTPFSEEAKIAGVHFDGGKRDDITVIVSYIS